MNWINLRTETVRSPEFVNAESGAIETWLRVLAFCCEQENGGRLAGACRWNDRAWMTTCGVTLSEAQNAHPLLHDDGVDFFVLNYPEEKEAEVKAKRLAGKLGGKQRAKNAKDDSASSFPRSNASSCASSCASTEGEGEGEVEGEKEKEKEVEVEGEAEITHAFEHRFAQITTFGIPREFAEMVFRDWDSRDGRDATGIRVKWPQYVSKRWKGSEGAQWKCGAHKAQHGANGEKPVRGRL